MPVQFTDGRFHADTDAGAPLAGGRLYTYVSGTTTHKATYTDYTLATPNTYVDDGTGQLYIALNSRGEASVWLAQDAPYTMVLKTSAGVTIWTDDGVKDSTADLLRADLASTASGKGASLVGKQGGGTVEQQVSSWIDAATMGAVADGVTDNTTAVQAALDALGTNGGRVEVARGTKFNLQSLTFPIRSNIDYWMDDDLSRPNPITTLGTNERVLYQANANGGGIVNEHRVTGAFHPSLNIDLRRDVAGHDAFLGASQKRIPDASTPARMSWNLFDQQVDTYRTVYEIYGGAYSQFTGITHHAWRRTVTITGIGTGAGGFVSVPAVGTEIIGSVSGAKGWFLSATSTTTTILWNSGKFAVGDKLIDDNETTTNTTSAVAFAVVNMNPLGHDLMRGNWSVGLPVGSPRDPFATGGGMCVMPSRSFGQYQDSTATDPYYAWSDAVADIPTNGFKIRYDTSVAAASRRLHLTKYGTTNKIGHVGAVRAYTNFSNSVLKAGSSYNVASLTRNATGDYTVTFTEPFTTADFTVSLATSQPLEFAYVFAISTSEVRIRVVTTGTSTLVDLTGQLHVTCVGGDI